jgi:hypothetical protein
MKLSAILLIILGVLTGGLWGWIQPTIFPIEKFGYLFMLTSFVGGMLIGYLICLIIDYFDLY